MTPRSSRDAIEDVDPNGELRVRLMAPPTDGTANAALVKLVARTLGLPRRAVTIASGTTSRHKRLRVDGVTSAELRQRWPDARVDDT